jgi:hypothetical protein
MQRVRLADAMAFGAIKHERFVIPITSYLVDSRCVKLPCRRRHRAGHFPAQIIPPGSDTPGRAMRPTMQALDPAVLNALSWLPSMAAVVKEGMASGAVMAYLPSSSSSTGFDC